MLIYYHERFQSLIVNVWWFDCRTCRTSLFWMFSALFNVVCDETRGVKYEMDKKIFMSRCCIYYSYLVPLHFIFGSATSRPPPLPTVHAPINSPLGLTPPFPLDRNKTISKQSSIIFSISYQEGKRQWE